MRIQRIRIRIRILSTGSEAARKANFILGSISSAFHFRDRHVFVNLYKIYIRPHLEFCTSGWSPWTESDLNTLERVQKRAIRMISGLNSESYEEKLKELNLLSLKKRRERADTIQTFKILQGFSDGLAESITVELREMQQTL